MTPVCSEMVCTEELQCSLPLYSFVFVSFVCVFVSYLQVLVLGEIEGGGGGCPRCAPLRICVYLCVFASWTHEQKIHTNTEVVRETSFSGKNGYNLELCVHCQGIIIVTMVVTTVWCSNHYDA